MLGGLRQGRAVGKSFVVLFLAGIFQALCSHANAQVTASIDEPGCWISFAYFGLPRIDVPPDRRIGSVHPTARAALDAATVFVVDRVVGISYCGLRRGRTQTPAGNVAQFIVNGDADVSGFFPKFVRTIGFLSESAEFCVTEQGESTGWTVNTIEGSFFPTRFPECQQSLTIRLAPIVGKPESQSILTFLKPGKRQGLIVRAFDDNDNPVQDVDISLELKAIAKSGGHGHGDDSSPQRTGTLSSDAAGATVSDSGRVLVGNTGSGGLIFEYQAPPASGDITIEAECADGRSCTQEGPDAAWVGVRGLIPLPPTSVYVLMPNRDTAHPDNHYMTPTAAFRLTALASLYHGSFPDDPLLHLNDASLERGGLLDFKARFGQPWLPPHQTHREGDIIDIRANPAINPATAIPERNFDAFKKIAVKTGGQAEVHDPGTPGQHFHVKF